MHSEHTIKQAANLLRTFADSPDNPELSPSGNNALRDVAAGLAAELDSLERERTGETPKANNPPDEYGQVFANALPNGTFPGDALALDGFVARLYRDWDGLLTVTIYTEEAHDVNLDHYPSGAPRLAVVVNDCRTILDHDGEWIGEDDYPNSEGREARRTKP